MSKDEILNFFSDINYAYNDSSRLDTLSCMLDELVEQAASPWHRVEEPPKESGKQYAVWASKGYAYCDKWLGDRWLISSVAPETVTHWMPIEPPKEEEHGN